MHHSRKRRRLTRRDFLRGTGLVLSSLLLEACGRRRVRVTATLPPSNGGEAPAASTIAQTQPVPLPTDTALAVEPADLALTGGHIYTMDPADSVAQALAVRGDRIVAVGADDQVRAFIGPQTEVIDVGGKMVMPGLIDAHNHLQVWGNLINNYLPLVPPEVSTLNQLLDRVAAAVAQSQPGEWIQGYYWNIDPPPNRADLDPISPDNPVWLIQQGGHFGSCNSMALEIAGITAQTHNPPGGVIERDSAGVPTGRFYNHRAMDLVRRYAPQPDQERIMANIRMAERKFAAVGVTTFQDCNARFSALQAYLEAGRRHAMMLRGDVFYTVEWPADLDRALNQIEPLDDEFMRFSGYKFLIDGQFPTWYTREPHPGISWDMPTWDPQNFKDAIKALHDTGFQIAVHCGGDAAVDLTLDAFEAAMNANPRPDPRHRIEHATICAKDSVLRMADRGGGGLHTASVHPLRQRRGGQAGRGTCWPDHGHPRLARCRRHGRPRFRYPLGSVVRAASDAGWGGHAHRRQRWPAPPGAGHDDPGGVEGAHDGLCHRRQGGAGQRLAGAGQAGRPGRVEAGPDHAEAGRPDACGCGHDTGRGEGRVSGVRE